MVFPKPLRTGAGIAVVAPASFVEHSVMEEGLGIVQNWGFKVVRGASLYTKHGQYAGTDAQRLKDLQEALDGKVRAIIMARGGYGISRILDRLDFTRFSKDPKWVVGFSDITALHSHLQKMGFASIHGPMPGYYNQPGGSSSADILCKLLRGSRDAITVPAHSSNRAGSCRGKLVGGNLSILCHLMGTSSEINTEGRILLLEDVGEYRYNIDRMFVQLKRSGKLEALSGLIIGYFNGLKEPENPLGQSLEEIVSQHTADYDFPVAFGFPVGHQQHNHALVLGAEAQLEVRGDASVLEYTTAQNPRAGLPV